MKAELKTKIAELLISSTLGTSEIATKLNCKRSEVRQVESEIISYIKNEY